jgi:hypothetical protein
LAAHWGRIIGLPVTINSDGESELSLPNCRFCFVQGAREIMSGLTFRVADVSAVCHAAEAKGYAVSGRSFPIGGVTFYLEA